MATQSGLNILTGFQVSAYSPIDTRYLYFGNTVPVPYASTSSAISSNPYYRYQGLTVLIGTQSNPQEYWWQNGTSDSDLVIKQKIGGLLQYAYKSYFPNIGSPNILYVDQSSNLSYYWSSTLATYSCTIDIFQDDLNVYLSPGYTFGKYGNGATISAIGKTSAQVILEAISQPLTPTVNISVIPTTVPYNTKKIIATVSVSYIINSNGATAASGIVSYASASNPYIIVGNNIGSTASYSNTFTYSFNYPALTQIVSSFKYEVTDTQASTKNIVATISMTPYATPNISLSAVRTNPQASEANDYFREIGNISTILSSNPITINSPSVPLLYYQLSYNNNGIGGYTNIGSTISINSGATISSIISPVLSTTASTATFRLTVTDLQQSNIITTSTIAFYYPYYWYRSTIQPTFNQIINTIGGTNQLPNTLHKVIDSQNTNYISGLSSPNIEYIAVAFPVSKTNWASSVTDYGTIIGTFLGSQSSITTSYWTATYYIYIISGAITKSNAINGYAFT